MLSICAPAVSGPAQQTQKPAQPATQQPAPQQPPPKSPDNNQFPEDTTNVPVLPNSATAPARSSAPEAAPPVHASPDDFDPVRSPDEPVGEPAADSEQGFSSSSAGLDHVPAPSDADSNTRKHGRKQAAPEAAHVESAQEDENVGAYYLSSKNWRAALSRFQSALVLDPENPDVYWGLAEAQRHLGDVAHARENYRKVMEYDPDSKHAREAKKLMDSPEMAHSEGAPKR